MDQELPSRPHRGPQSGGCEVGRDKNITRGEDVMAIDLRDGIYKGRGIEGSEQYGEKNGNLELIVDVVVQVPADGARPAHPRQLSTAHYLTHAASQYVYERLRALGWEGNDIRDLPGITKNEVDIQVKTEDYHGKPVTKVEILS